MIEREPLQVVLFDHRIRFMVELPPAVVATLGLYASLRRGWRCAREMRHQWRLQMLAQPGPSKLVH